MKKLNSIEREIEICTRAKMIDDYYMVINDNERNEILEIAKNKIGLCFELVFKYNDDTEERETFHEYEYARYEAEKILKYSDWKNIEYLYINEIDKYYKPIELTTQFIRNGEYLYV